MTHSRVSSLPETEVAGFLRIFFSLWNIMGSSILGVFIFHTQSHLGSFEKVSIFILCALLCTLISFLLGIKAKVSPLGMIDTQLAVKSKMTFKVFFFALVAQTVPLWGKPLFFEDWRIFLLVGILIVPLWLSAKSIEINVGIEGENDPSI